MEMNHTQLYAIYNKLYTIGKNINENTDTEALYEIAVEFATNELSFEKCVIFEHDDNNGWFKVKKSKGYNNPIEQKILNIINLLLSGEVVEYLRVNGKPIIHTKENPKIEVQALLKSIFLSEAYLELFGGDKNVPFGLIIVGNGLADIERFSRLLEDSFSILALGNFTNQLSNTINNIFFYKAWQVEKEKLEENITKRTKQLEEQKRIFEAIYKTSKDGIAVLDIETTAFLDVNPAYCEMTGFSRDELLRTSCLKLSIPEDKERSILALQEVKEKGYITNFIKTCIIKGDKFVVVNMSISLMDNGTKILLSSKDITKQKELELQLQTINVDLETRIHAEVEKNRKNEFQLLEQSKNASMGEMIGNIAHQWRQPLSAITSLASALKISDEIGIIDSAEVHNKMDNIINKANYLSQTIDTFRNFLKTGNESRAFSLEKMLERSLQIVDASMKDFHIQVYGNVDYSKNTMITGVESEISQVIINILNNAKDVIKEKHIPKPWVKLELIVEQDGYFITIEDNGGGIPANVVSKIFDPYFTTKHQSQGTGLGLHMSYRIITESFNGKIYVRNTENGAKFFLELPSSS